MIIEWFLKFVFLLFACITILFGIFQLIKSSLEERKKDKESKQSEIERHKAYISFLYEKFEREKNDLSCIILKYFHLSFRISNRTSNFSYTFEKVQEKYKELQSILFELKKKNEKLVSLKADENVTVSNAESSFLQIQSMVKTFKSLGIQIENLPSTYMVDINNYGQIRREYWSFINRMSRILNNPLMDRNSIFSYISDFEKEMKNLSLSDSFNEEIHTLSQWVAYKENKINQFMNVMNDPSSLNSFKKICSIDLGKIIDYIWYFSIQTPFSASDFQRAKDIFEKIYGGEKYLDLILAELYAKKKIDGEEILQSKVREIITNERDAHFLSLLASGLMWMNAPKNERIVLEYMVTNTIEMAPQLQERLHFLSYDFVKKL